MTGGGGPRPIGGPSECRGRLTGIRKAIEGVETTKTTSSIRRTLTSGMTPGLDTVLVDRPMHVTGAL